MSDEKIREIGERFARDTAGHQMTVLHDNGLYRHLRFMAPRHSAYYWFDLITVPHALIFRGDGESYVFSRLEDMFEFFRGKNINPHYWAEKLTSDRDSVMRYDEDLFRQYVTDEVEQAITEQVVSPEHADRLRQEVREELLDDSDTTWEDGARQTIAKFSFYENEDDEFDWKKQPDFFFEADEGNFRDFHWWYLWACHAIVWGIAQYDGRSATPVPATPADDAPTAPAAAVAEAVAR